MNAGDARAYTDPSGDVWAADRYFTGGSMFYTGNVPIAGTTSDRLFQSHRWGMSAYSIPVTCPGTYKVTMNFAETAFFKKGKRVFTVTGEGTAKLTKLDVFVAAGGANRALTKSFDVVVKDSYLNLGFKEVVEDPMVSGIQVTRAEACATPTTAPTTAAPTTAAPTTAAPTTAAPTSTATPAFDKRLNVASSASYTDDAGKVWTPDAGFVGGTSWDGGAAAVTGTTSDPLYQKNRWGMSGYTVSVPTARTYRVTLYLAEMVFSQAGQRVFDVTAEGATKVDNLDVFAVAGKNAAYSRTFDVSVTDGTLNLGFSASQDDPMVSAIQVSSSTSTALPTTPAPTTPAPTTPAPTTPAPTTPAPTTPAPTNPPTTGFPSASNTGVPAGTTLRSSGGMTVTQNGAVIDALDISGSIRVEANNVTIKRTRIRNPGGMAIWINPNNTGTLIEDVELDGSGNSDGTSAVGYSNFTMRRTHIHNYGEGPAANGNVVIEDSYMANFTNFINAGAHQDGIQMEWGDNMTIRHNTIMMNVDGANSAIWVSAGNSHSNVSITNNLVAGASFSLGLGNQASATNNRISTRFYPNGGYFGPFTYTGGSATKSGNTFYESGNPA